MKKKCIAIYGGTQLLPKESEFLSKLAFSILDNLNIKLVTGGFRYKEKEDPEIKSTDEAVAEGAERFSQKRKNKPLGKYLETWLPKSDNRKELVDRFHKGKICWIDGDQRVRRLKLMDSIDALITLKGMRETSLVLDAALAKDLLFLPLPFAGEDSENYWNAKKNKIISYFDMPAQFVQDLESINLAQSPQSEIDKLIQDIVGTLRLALEKADELIFISYSDDNYVFVERFGKILKENGLGIWLDKWEIQPGEDWAESIDAALDTCSKMILIFSPDAVESKEVQAEYNRFLKAGKTIIPLLYQDCKIPYRLDGKQFIEFTQADLEDESKIKELVKKL